MNIAVIPARGGSKRIPRKNIKHFYGKPILQWPITAVMDSGLFERVIVSTDDEEVAEIALAAGAEVPFYRPAELANDYAATVPVIRHAIQALGLSDTDIVCCIYPTAVFSRAADLRQAMMLLQETEADFVMPVTAYSCPLARAMMIDATGRLKLSLPQHENTRTQDCDTFYHDVGQYYLGTAAAWLRDKAFYEQDVRALVTPRFLAHDIDTPDDWYFAELVFRAINEFSYDSK